MRRVTIYGDPTIFMFADFVIPRLTRNLTGLRVKPAMTLILLEKI